VVRQIARQLGVRPEVLCNWIRRDEADTGLRADRLSTPECKGLAWLRSENRELRRANAILKAASAYFAVQLDRTVRRS
jgi:transposase